MTFSIIILFTTISCKKPGNPVTPPIENRAKLELSTVDTLCTSVFLKISKVHFTAPASILLYRDSIPVKSFYVWGADTVIFQDSLLPGTNYTYRAQVTDGPIVNDAVVLVRTLDITDNNYSYQTWEFGATHRHSFLYDVAVINDNDIWAVGEIYMADSLGKTIDTVYNGIHWDGVSWKPIRIPTQSYGGFLGAYALSTIFEFAPDNIWTFSQANSYSHFLNGRWKTENTPFSTYINELWGTSSNAIYGACFNGSMAHFTGTSWVNESTGTTVALCDLAGSSDGKVIWACGYEPDYSSTVLLRKMNNTWVKLYEGTSWGIFNGSYINLLKSLWTNSPYKVYINNIGGLFTLGTYENTNWKNIATLNGAINCMRGSDDNDIWICGDYGLIGHYNGQKLSKLNQFYNRAITYRALSIKGNTVCVVGGKSDALTTKMEIVVLRRN